MKANFLVLLLALLTLMGCSNDNDADNTLGSPTFFFFYLELSNLSGEIPKDRDVVITRMESQEDGGFNSQPIESIQLAIDERHSNQAGKTLYSNADVPRDFDTGIFYGGGWVTEEEAGGPGNTWINDKYFLIKYKENEIDTLRVRDSTKVGDYRHFSFYLNEEKLELHSLQGEEFNPNTGGDIYFSVIKDIEWENIQEN